MKIAAKELREHKSVIVRKADKANMFVIMEKSEYKQKLNNILNDPEKFKELKSNPIRKLKVKLNKMINKVNNGQNQKILHPIVGECHPGYLYGTVKIHKQNNPLRPIISQIPTPTYKLAKQLNAIIADYLPAKYQISSTDEFLSIIRATRPSGIVASLDATSLFTNVPVRETVDNICQQAYHHSTLPPPPFAENLLRELLISCTTESPFTHVDGKLYVQCDGLSMGSPLAVTMAKFYMVYLENTVFF